MDQREPADRQDEQDFLGRVGDGGQRVASEHRKRDLLRQQRVPEIIALHRPSDEQPFGRSEKPRHEPHAKR